MPRTLSNLVIAFLLACSPFSFSAEFNIVNNGRMIVLQGVIEEGDFEKFLDAVLVGGLRADRVFLASPGGDAIEAFKIGRLIRALGYSTEAPLLLGEAPLCNPQIGVESQNCLCLSACTMVYIAGVEREGNYLGVHRIFLNYADSRNLSLAESIELSDFLAAQTTAYLLEMNSPPSLIEKISNSSSDQIQILDTVYVQNNLEGFIPSYDEWLIARCGSRNALTSDWATFNRDEYGVISDCYDKELLNESERAFYQVIQEAIARVNLNLIPTASRLGAVHDLPPFDLSDLIGLNQSQAIDRLSLFGATLPPEFAVERLLDIQFIFNDTLIVGFDTDGTVYLVEIPFIVYDEDRRTYTGFFLKDMNLESTPQEFISKYGPLNDSGCYPSDNCFMSFQRNNESLNIIFDPEDKLYQVMIRRI